MGAQPTQLSAKHQLMALMVAAGRQTGEIATAVGLTPDRVSVVRASPLFRELVRQHQRQLRDTTLGDLAGRLQAEGDGTLDALVELRDQRLNLTVALGAANSIFDRVAPRRTTHEEARTVTVRFNRDDLQQMLSAVAEEDGQVIDLAAIDSPTGRRVAVLPIDDAIAAAEMAAVAKEAE